MKKNLLKFFVKFVLSLEMNELIDMNEWNMIWLMIEISYEN